MTEFCFEAHQKGTRWEVFLLKKSLFGLKKTVVRSGIANSIPERDAMIKEFVNSKDRYA